MLGAAVCGVVSAQTNTWSYAAPMAAPRSAHTSTLLSNGKVVAAGGCTTYNCEVSLSTVETYDPVANSWSASGGLKTGRSSHTGTLLNNGLILLAGGCPRGAPCSPTASAELYNPQTGASSLTGPLNTPRYAHTATLLADGRVLVVGGLSVCDSSTCNPLRSAELYDPATGVWTTVANYPSPVTGHVAARLSTSDVIVVGGCSTSGLPCNALGASLFHPATLTWSPAATPLVPRTQAAVTLLPTGRLLLAGGVNGQGYQQTLAEQYDPGSNVWFPSGNATSYRYAPVLVTLQSGDALMSGGDTPTAEVYRAAANQWAATGSLNTQRSLTQPVVLPSGDVLEAGGRDADFNNLASTEIYHPGNAPLVSLVPTSLDVGLVQLGTVSEPVKLLVTNSGNATLTLQSAAFTGNNAGDFTARIGCPGGSVAPGATCVIQVRAVPKALGLRTAALVLTDNAPNSPQTVSVQATGYADTNSFWQPAGVMNRLREALAMVTLPDGRALAMGGAATASADLYDPQSRTWTATAPMKAPRFDFTATLLDDGRVLAAGGGVASAELFSATGSNWTLTGAMGTARAHHAASKLSDGRVLVSGGCGGNACNSAEIFEPMNGQWHAAAPMNSSRVFHTSTLLPNGRVLVTGGGNLSAEIYDPAGDQWTPVPSMDAVRSGHTASLLAGGAVLVAGGCNGDPCVKTQVYDSLTNTWRAAAPMRIPRVSHNATALSDGRLLMNGGYYFCDSEFGFCFPTSTAEVYRPDGNRWTLVGPMISPRVNQATVLLLDGNALTAGGQDENSVPLASAETFKQQ